MALYKYRGRTSQGQSVSGQLEAADSAAVASFMQGRGWVPVSIDQGRSDFDVLGRIKKLFEPKVSTTDLIMFSRQMYTVTRSGIPLVKGIQGVAASLQQPVLQQVLQDIAERLTAGNNLTTALRAHPNVFNNLYISLIHVGENTGRLDQAFEQIAAYLHRDAETVRSIRSATQYPTFVLIALAVALVIANVLIIPAFSGMFEKMGADLPLPTRFLIGMSDLFLHQWYWMLLFVGVAIVGVRSYIQTPKGRWQWGRQRLRLPIIGSLISRATNARYARTLSMMLQAGVPLPRALDLCAKAVDNDYLLDKISKIRAGVESGEGLLRTHLQSGLFPPLVLQMISVGEESGQVDDLLMEVAEFYDREVEYELQSLARKIEPLLIVVMTGFVLVLALGIFLPIWDSYSVQSV